MADEDRPMHRFKNAKVQQDIDRAKMRHDEAVERARRELDERRAKVGLSCSLLFRSCSACASHCLQC